MSLKPSHSIIITRLTALWALSECGLGGVMHALHIPFTGIFVGGIAVICISLIAFHTNEIYKEIIKSTILVLMIKAGVSPQTPVPAYIAVAFQGILGAIIFSSIKNFKIAATLFGCMAITESAIQQFLFTTLIFGKSIWVALDIFMASILRDLHLPNNFSFSVYLVMVYVILYFIWGLLLGLFISNMPMALIKLKSENILIERSSISIQLKKKKASRFVYFFMLAFIVTIFIIDKKINLVLYVVLRSLAITLLLFFIIRPMITQLINHWGGNKKKKLSEITKLFPELRGYVMPAYSLAKKSFKGINRIKYFLLYLIHFTISDNKDE